jgi:hypothetical protein
MANLEHQSDRLSVSLHQPLIGIIRQRNGERVIEYFTDEQTSQEASNSNSAANRVRKLAGVWSDLDWDDMERGLDRIRHETPPSPPKEV